MTILDEILEHKRVEVEEARRCVPARRMRELARQLGDVRRGFRDALAKGPAPRVVAEIKFRSPSAGEIRGDLDPAACARIYREAGAAALSVLTDERFFGGRVEYVRTARDAAPLPVLRKDFVIDPYQIDEAAAAGADAVLLIAAALSERDLADLRRYATDLALDVLVEVHDEPELEMALGAGADLIGINNRDLRSFEVDLAVTERLLPRIPAGAVVVAESGIRSRADVERLAAAGVKAFLVGESLMRRPDVGAALRELRGAT